MRFFQFYFLDIGGMPEVVESYVKYKDYNRVRKIQNEILLAYEKVTTCKIPLDGYIDYNAFKLYFLDVGLQ